MKRFKKPVLALVAHDDFKSTLVKLVQPWVVSLPLFFELVGTRGTAQRLDERLGLSIRDVGHGPEGADLTLAEMIRQRKVDYIVFLVDPRFDNPAFAKLFPHAKDIETLILTAIKEGIPHAFNASSAALLLSQLIMQGIFQHPVRSLVSGVDKTSMLSELLPLRQPAHNVYKE